MKIAWQSKKVSEFDCGSASGCYDLGGTLFQILMRIGDERFASQVKKLPAKSLSEIAGLLKAGVFYNGLAGNLNSFRDKSFPMSYRLLNSIKY